jgi:hypothetical protein
MRNGEKVLVGKLEVKRPIVKPSGKLDNNTMILVTCLGWILYRKEPVVVVINVEI